MKPQVHDKHTFNPMTLDPRAAGKVTRWHTWERIRDQSVGEHTWQVMRIVLAIYPTASRGLLVYALFHDVGERVTGDVPFPVKRENPEVKAAFESMEQDALLRMATAWGAVAGVVLSDEEATVFKLAEYIEMMEWSLDEMALGNQNATLPYRRCFAQAARMLNDVPPDVRRAAENYVQRRLQHERSHRNLPPG